MYKNLDLTSFSSSRYGPKLPTSKIAICGVFDMNTSKWCRVKEYNYQCKSDYDYRCFKRYLANNNQIESDIYMISNVGAIDRYNMNKDEWIQLNGDRQFGGNSNPILSWFDQNPNLLYVAFGNANSAHFYCFGVRNSDKKWNRMEDVSKIASDGITGYELSNVRPVWFM